MKKIKETSLNKVLFLTIGIIAYSGCANINLKPSNLNTYTENTKTVLSAIKSLVAGVDPSYLLETEKESSFVIAYYKGVSAKLKLTNIDDIKHWKSRDETITTYHGKIISTFGLKNDMNITNFRSVKDFYLSDANKEFYTTFYSFKDPEAAYLAANVELSNLGATSAILLNNISYELTLVEEIVSFPVLNKIWKNYYWISNDGTVLMSKQNIAPFSEKIRLEFYY